MEIQVLSLPEAKKHVPLVPTYAIRIFSGNPSENTDHGELVSSPNYRFIREYFFDEIDNPNYQEVDDEGNGEGFKLFDLLTAEKIIREFERGKSGCLELMVHCRQGCGRSPAVAAALNDIFNLGEDSQRFFSLYPNLNSLVYWRMIHKADEMGLVRMSL